MRNFRRQAYENKTEAHPASRDRLLLRLLPCLPRLGGFCSPTGQKARRRTVRSPSARPCAGSSREQRIRDYTVLELAQGKKLARKAYCLNGWLFTKLGRTSQEQLNELQAALNTAADTGLPLVYCAVPLKNEVLHDIDPAYFSDEVGAENKEALFAMLAGVDRLTAIDASASSCSTRRTSTGTPAAPLPRRRRSRGSWPRPG